MISRIRIENVKGYGVPGKTMELSLSASKINLCVASNGFGKSSLSTAFAGLKPRHLEIEKKDKHANHVLEDSSIELYINSEKYYADKKRNEIARVLDTFVIRSRVFANSKKTPTPYSFHVDSYVDVRDIVVCPVQNSPKAPVSFASIKTHFGKNGKLLEPLSPLLEFIARKRTYDEIEDVLKKFKSSIKRSAVLNSTAALINAIDGTVSQLRTRINDSIFDEIESEELYLVFLRCIDGFFLNDKKLNSFCAFFQLFYLYEKASAYLLEEIKYLEYIYLRNCLDESLLHLNTTYQGIHTSVENRNLVIKFPKADMMSNGQRDVMTFAAELLCFESTINPKKKQLLIIDEVFDYLDDANVMAAQYFLSEILLKNKGNVYVMLLTHLNPYCFRNYVFSPKVINPVFLDNSQAKSNKQMMRFISFREGLDKKLPSNKELYDSLSLNLFHYTPNPINLTQDITEASDGKQGIKTSWGNCKVLKEYLIQEINKYFSIDTEYDPYAVALALRLRVEKLAYQKLPTEELKEAFLNTHTTKAKFEFCENHNVFIPPVYYMVNAIHNDADHLKYDSLNDKFQERNTVYKLQNGVIKKIMQEVFEYKGKEVLLSSI